MATKHRTATPKYSVDLTSVERFKILESLEKLSLGENDFLVIRVDSTVGAHAFADAVGKEIKRLRPDWLGNALYLPSDESGLQTMGWLAQLKYEDLDAILKKLEEIRQDIIRSKFGE